MNFREKVVLITGAASGIGAGTAHHLASLGAKLSLVDLNEKLLDEVIDEITKNGYSKPLAIVADVTKDAKRIINETTQHFGQLDVLVNNAGIGTSDSVIDFDADNFDRMIDVNLKSMIILANLAVPHLEKTHGNIVNVSSVLGLHPLASGLSYCVSKAGVDQFTKCSALSLAPKRIRVNAVNPGIIETPLYGLTGIDLSQFIETKKQKNQLVEKTGEPLDVARTIAYLASETFVNGILLSVDGGTWCKGSLDWS